MKRTIASVVLLISLTSLFFSCEKNKLPNIVFFLVDDMGWRDVGIYGSDFYDTPNIDQLATNGIRFTQAYAASHVCSPTRASILTGKYPARLALTDWLNGRAEHDFEKLRSAKYKRHLPFEDITLPEELKKGGYKTAIFGKWHLGEDPSGPLEHGFDFRLPKWNKCCPNKTYYSPFGLEGLEDSEGGYLTDRLTDEALKYIEENKNQPFFLYLSHFAVHDPIHGRLDLVEKYKNKLNKRNRSLDEPFVLEGNPDDLDPSSPKDLKRLIKQSTHEEYKVLPQRTVKIKQYQDNVHFAAMVESVDESLGRVIRKLKDLNLEENTIVIFYSDNGGMSGANFGHPDRIISSLELDKYFATSNLPLRGAKGWLYEGGIRVPLIVKWPGELQAGKISDELVMSTDFYPTTLEMAGLSLNPDQHVDGQSFLKALNGESYDRKAIFWHFPHYSNHGMQSPGGAIRLGAYKLLEYFENGSIQLFNLENDPGEQQDIALNMPEKVAELQVMLKNWRNKVSAEMPRVKD